MTFITADDLINFAKKIPDEDDNSPQTFADSAMEIVEEYLGYNPEEQTYTTTRRGDGGKLFDLSAKPINEIKKAFIDGVETDVSLFTYEKKSHRISFLSDNVFSKNSIYEFTYSAGFATVPNIIKTVALQIADLLWESSGGNLAVSSTSFADTGSRVFNNFTPDRFLKQLDDFTISKMAV